MNKALFEKHIELVEAVNNALTEDDHRIAHIRLIGFRDAVDVLGEKHLIACDNHYLDQGINRPMCCGVWLDWQPNAVMWGCRNAAKRSVGSPTPLLC